MILVVRRAAEYFHHIRIISLAELFAAGAFASAIAVIVGGPFRIVLFKPALHAASIAAPLISGALALVIRVGLAWRDRRTERGQVVAAVLYRVVAGALLAADLVLVLGHVVMSCGGLDSAGYLGAARLFLAGKLTDTVPIAGVLPFSAATDAAAPLGFVPAAMTFHIAPRFPPGLPIVMAAAIALAGSSAPFLLAPLMGAAAVALTGFLAGRRSGPIVGVLAAVLLASSQVFLDMSVQPMSDVPAMLWVVLAAFLIWRPAPLAVAGGIAIGMAILTRPPLALVALTLTVITRWRTRRQAAVFAAVSAAFVVTLMALQWHLYGDPLQSGYGSAGGLFTWTALYVNAVNHAKWLVVIHSPLLIPLFIAGIVFDPPFGWRAAAVFLATVLPYLFYAARFEDWEILRFVLPGLPFVFATCAGGVVQLAGGRSHPARARIAAMCIAAGAAAVSYTFLANHGVFEMRERERKYPLVGEWFATQTPVNSAAIASLHSGSLRYYSGRAVLRMEAIPENGLSGTIDALQRAGFDTYVVLEQGDELENYEHRFHPDTIAGLLIEPVARIRGVNIFHLVKR